MGVDICLTVLLPVLMAEIITGQEFHEWAGVAMTVLFIVHHILNWRWWNNIWKGGCGLVRFVSVMLNLLMLADILALAVSGIMISGFVFDWLSSGAWGFARRRRYNERTGSAAGKRRGIRMCSLGGGRFGQSLTAIAKLALNAK